MFFPLLCPFATVLSVVFVPLWRWCCMTPCPVVTHRGCESAFPHQSAQTSNFLNIYSPLPPGKDEEYPKKPLGQLPPELAAVVNHVANGQSHAEPVKPPREPSPVAQQQTDSRPPSRMRRDSLDRLVRRRDSRSRGSGEIPKEHKQPSTTTPERGTRQTSAPVPPPQGHATANQNSNAISSSSHRDITPRWVKPSKTKLEEVRAAAVHNVALSRGASPAPFSSEDAAQADRRPQSQGFVPGSNRDSNASQYDNVPELPEQQFEILDLEHPPSRLRAVRNDTPFSASSNQDSPAHGPGLAGSAAPGPRMVTLPSQFYHNSPTRGSIRYHTPPQQPSPGRSTTEVPIFHPAYTVSLDHREDGPYGPPSQFIPSNMPYATTQRPTREREKLLMNNSYTTYRRQPPTKSTHNSRNVRAPPELPQGRSTPIYLQQFTSTSQVFAPIDYRQEGHQRGEQNPTHTGVWQPEGDGLLPQSPGGMPRSPSFQQAQMSPLPVFTFPDNPAHFGAQFQEQQPLVRQQHPQLFGGQHYRHAQEAFAMQESMLL